MTAKWSFGSVPIYVTEDDPSRDIYRVRLKILDSTIDSLQFLGAGSRMHSIKGIIVSQADFNQLEIWAYEDTSQTFTSDQGSQGSYKINGALKGSRLKFASAMIDGVSYTASDPLYEIQLELISIT